ncbi:hypothetical protein IWQ62_001286, partial [Dispira parvispora]
MSMPCSSLKRKADSSLEGSRVARTVSLRDNGGKGLNGVLDTPAAKSLKQKTIEMLFQGQARLAREPPKSVQEEPPVRVFARGKKGLPPLTMRYHCPTCRQRSTRLLEVQR